MEKPALLMGQRAKPAGRETLGMYDEEFVHLCTQSIFE